MEFSEFCCNNLMTMRREKNVARSRSERCADPRGRPIGVSAGLPIRDPAMKRSMKFSVSVGSAILVLDFTVRRVSTRARAPSGQFRPFPRAPPRSSCCLLAPRTRRWRRAQIPHNRPHAHASPAVERHRVRSRTPLATLARRSHLASHRTRRASRSAAAQARGRPSPSNRTPEPRDDARA